MKTGGRQTIYRIQDGCFRFWYRFVQPNLSTIELGAGSAALEVNVVPELNSFMGLGFERIVADLFDRDNAAGKLPELYQNRARWWGNDRNTAIRRNRPGRWWHQNDPVHRSEMGRSTRRIDV
ncbi:Archaea bacterial proteins of uncharacterised function [Mobiluncus holmesii]|nr:Archaea bacterial proteins of uncharacterised function [Mobiluncus holmesii]